MSAVSHRPPSTGHIQSTIQSTTQAISQATSQALYRLRVTGCRKWRGCGIGREKIRGEIKDGFPMPLGQPLHSALLRYGCRIQDARCKPGVRVFRWSGSVLGARCSALGVDSAQVPGTRSQVPDSRYPIPGTRYRAPGGMPVSCFEKPAHGVCKIGRARIPVTWCPEPGT